VPSKNERVELEMQIMKYRQIMSRTTNTEFLRQTEEKIMELERKLRVAVIASSTTLLLVACGLAFTLL
jgi:uncharacterized membrane protein